jgi:hypothetical protein
MIVTICLSPLLIANPEARPLRAEAPLLRDARAQDPDPKAEYKARREVAEGDPEALWKLHEWCTAYNFKAESNSCLRAIIKLEPDHKQARAALGHVYYDDRWFTSEQKLKQYKQEQLELEAKRTGKVIHEGKLIDPEELKLIEAGLVKVDGRWINAEEAKKIEAGWVLQDTTWIPPGEVANVEQGLWKCGDQWLDAEEADRYHGEIGRWWQIPTEHFVLYSTCSRETSQAALNTMEHSYRQFARAFGRSPAQAVPVLLLNSTDQYGRFGAGDAGIENPDPGGLSSVHGAFFADGWIEVALERESGAGVAYWDASTEGGSRFGEMFARHAAAQSIAEALDPSPRTMENWRKGRRGSSSPDDFWAEKSMPRWFRYGVAAYVERYMPDSLVAAGGDPDWRRAWSVSNIARAGGLDSLDEIFEFDISVDNRNSAKLINEAGLIVAFILDGKCPPVINQHGALKVALKEGKPADVTKATKGLVEEIKDNEAKLRAFAGF